MGVSFSIVQDIAVFGSVPSAWRPVLRPLLHTGTGQPVACLCNLDDPNAYTEFEAFTAVEPNLTEIVLIGCSDRSIERVLDSGFDIMLPLSASPADLTAQLGALDRRLIILRTIQDRAANLSNRLRKVQAEFDAIDTDLFQAKQLQQGLIKDRQRHFDTGCLSLMLQEKMHIGGDMVGQFPVNDSTVGFFAFDVVGHGVTAALLIARLTGMVLGMSPDTNIAITADGDGFTPRSPAAVCEALNVLMFNELSSDHYFTAILGFFNHRTGKVTFCQAGHPSPILIHAKGHMQIVGKGGLPMGLIPGAEFEDIYVTLGAGERLLIMSDGITETPNRKRSSQLTEVGLAWLLAKYRTLPALDLFDCLLADLADFQGTQVFEDDLSAVMLDFKPDATNEVNAARSPDTAKDLMATS